MYLKSAETVVTIPVNYALIFCGDLPHGGITAKVSDKRKTCAAIHGHLQEINSNKRSAAVVGLSKGHRYCVPEHMVVMDPEMRRQYVRKAYNDLRGCVSFLKKRVLWTADKEVDEDFANMMKGLSELKDFAFLKEEPQSMKKKSVRRTKNNKNK